MHIHKKEIRLFRILTLLTVASLALAVFLPKKSESRAVSEEGRFVLLLQEVDAALEPHLHIGDRVIDRQNRRILGDILEIRAEASLRVVFSETRGEFVITTVPGKYDLHLTLSAEQRDGAIVSMGGESVRLGQTYYFRTYDFTGEGRVVALQ